MKGKYKGGEIEFNEEKIEESFCSVADKDAEIKKISEERDSFKTQYEKVKKEYETAFNSNKPKTPSGDELLDRLKNDVKELFK